MKKQQNKYFNDFTLTFYDKKIESDYKRRLEEYQKASFVFIVILLMLMTAYVQFVNRPKERNTTYVSIFSLITPLLVEPILALLVFQKLFRFIEYITCFLYFATFVVVTANDEIVLQQFYYFQRGVNGMFMICTVLAFRVRFKIAVFVLPFFHGLFLTYLRYFANYTENYGYVPTMNAFLCFILIGKNITFSMFTTIYYIYIGLTYLIERWTKVMYLKYFYKRKKLRECKKFINMQVPQALLIYCQGVILFNNSAARRVLRCPFIEGEAKKLFNSMVVTSFKPKGFCDKRERINYSCETVSSLLRDLESSKDYIENIYYVKYTKDEKAKNGSLVLELKIGKMI